MTIDESGNGPGQEVERHQRDRAAIRNAIAVLSAVQLGVVGWMLIDRSRSGRNADPDLNLIVFLVAFVDVLVVTRLGLSRQLRALRRGLGLLCGFAVTLSLISFSLVDYGTLREGGLVLPTVLVVAILLALMRGRR